MTRMTLRRDLLFQDEIRDAVRRAYRAIPTGAGRAVAERFYDPAELADVPDPAVAWALGVGNPVRHAGLSEGDVVLDVGCGGGLDSVLASRRVGPTGRVIGLDMLEEMCERARAAVQAAGTSGWCQFERAEMEALPLPDASVDVVISNGVINLSPRKGRALAEIARVLAPGGRLCLADVTVDGDLPPEVLASDAAWAGCIAGAVSGQLLATKVERAGLSEVELSEHVPFTLDDVALYPLFTDDVVALMRRLLPERAQQRVAVGVILHARKPSEPHAHAADPGATRVGQVAATVATTPLEDIPADTVEAPGVTVRHLKRVEDVELKVLDVQPGQSTPFHTHPHAHEGVVVSGAGRLQLEGRSEPLQPGDVFSVGPTAPHAIASDGAGPLRFVCMDCFVQPRPEATQPEGRDR